MINNIYVYIIFFTLDLRIPQRDYMILHGNIGENIKKITVRTLKPSFTPQTLNGDPQNQGGIDRAHQDEDFGILFIAIGPNQPSF